MPDLRPDAAASTVRSEGIRLAGRGKGEFAAPLQRLQEAPPHPLGASLLRILLGFLGLILIWAAFGKLDIVAVADGKLVPQSYVKIVQPAEAGIVKEILVREGETVAAGQILMRMDALAVEADGRSIDAEYRRRLLSLVRIDAELADRPFAAPAGFDAALVGEIGAQYRANRAARDAALAEEKARLMRAREELAVAVQVQSKLEASVPHYRAQEQAYDKLHRDGYAGPLMASDKRRERVEKEQELETQRHMVESARAGIGQSEMKLAQLDADYRRQLNSERNDARSAVDRLEQELAKQTHRQSLLELKAPQAAIVKDLATHTVGTVVQPGTVVLTLVPRDDALRAEVWVGNDDIGFVRPGQAVHVKLAAYPFQKYGLIEGRVEHVGADAQDGQAGDATGRTAGEAGRGQTARYKALVALQSPRLVHDGEALPLAAGMQASAEIMLGQRSVLEYLLSPVRKAWHEAARER